MNLVKSVAERDEYDSRFTGKLVKRGDDGYESARLSRIFHSRYPDRYPAAVLMAQTENDIVEGVRLAKEKGWKVGVRSGGHSFPVWSVRDDALLIDLGGFKEMSFDPDTNIATATPSVQGGNELNPFLHSYGRFFGGGACPSVGIGGFLLQGGIGWNFRGWGYAAEQVVAIDVVTADGQLVRADETQNADLFWAARGSGPGFFGVITRYHLRTRSIPGAMLTTALIFPVNIYAKLLEWMAEANQKISSDVHLVGSSVVPAFPVPGHDGGFVFIVWGLAFCDTVEDSAAALAPLKDCPFLDEALFVLDVQPTDLQEQYANVDAIHPEGLRYRVDSAWVDGSNRDMIDAARMLVLDRPIHEPGHTFFQFALPREAPDMAMSLKTDLMVGAYIIYREEKDDETYRNWSLAAMGALEPYTVGQYWGDSDTQHRRVKCLTDQAWERLKHVREQRDPHALFVGYLAGEREYDNSNGWEVSGANPANRPMVAAAHD